MTKPRDSDVEKKLRQKLVEGSQDHQDYRNLADHLASLGRLDEAASLYEEVLNKDVGILQKARVATDLGWLFYEMGKLDRAEMLAESVLSLLSKEQETPDVLLLRGMSQALSAHCVWYQDATSVGAIARGALHWLDKLIATFPEWQEITTAYYTAARLHGLLGNSKETIALCQKVLRYELTPLDRLSCLVIYSGALRIDGQLQESEKTLVQALQYSDELTWPRLYFELGLVHRQMGRTAEAEEDFKKALEMLRTHPYLHDDVHFSQELHWNLAEVYYDLEKYREAVSAFQKVYGSLSEDDPDHWNALLWVGYCRQAIGDHATAQECFHRVLASSFSSSDDRVFAEKALGEIHYELGEYAEAASAFQRFLAAHPEDDSDHRDALLWLGCCYEATADYEKSRECFERVLASPYSSESGKTSAQEGLARLPKPLKKILH